ncbi:MAG TPA: DUF4339 domain-containing protein [Bdellovibrionota bacterium]|nr:DUF4339 domain-containing protein [Bdellovibrionota bacterium]
MGETALKIQSERAYWFVARGDDLLGPFMSSQLFDQLRDATLGPSDFCWKDGFAEWRPIASVSDFASECRGKTFAVVAYPKMGIPSQKSLDTGKRRRAADSMTLLSLAPENRKVVQVNFAKTRVRRLSLYEWAFAMIFAMVCTYVGSKLTLDAVVTRMEQLRQQRYVAGRFQRLGTVSEDAFVLSEYAALPLLSAPSLGNADYYVFGAQQGTLHRPTMSFVAYKSGNDLGNGTWKLDGTYAAHFWNPAAHELDPVYRRPVQTTALVPSPTAPAVSPVLRGEPYLY